MDIDGVFRDIYGMPGRNVSPLKMLENMSQYRLMLSSEFQYVAKKAAQDNRLAKSKIIILCVSIQRRKFLWIPTQILILKSDF